VQYYLQVLPRIRANGDRWEEAALLNRIGAAFLNSGEREKALENFGAALPLRRAVGDLKGEAITLNNLALTHDLLGDKDRAFVLYRQVLPLRRKTGDQRGEAITLQNMGSIYASLGEPEQALDYYLQALEVSRAGGLKRLEGAMLNNIGRIWSLRGEKDKAIQHYRTAVEIYETINDRPDEVVTLNNLGRVYASRDHITEALDYHHQALAIAKAARDGAGEALTERDLGRLYRSVGDPSRALEHLSRALELRSLEAVPERESDTLYEIALCERDRGNFAEARARMEAAIAILESVRASVPGPDLQASMGASMQDRYRFYVDLVMQLHRLHPAQGFEVAALEASERARARSLLDLIAEARVNIREGVDPGLLQRERRLTAMLASGSGGALALSGDAGTRTSSTTSDRDRLLNEYRAVQAEIRARSPRYAALTRPEPLRLDEIQHQLDQNTVLLEYMLGPERSYLWLVSADGLEVHELPGQALIEGYARRMHKGLGTGRLAATSPECREAAFQLSRIVLGPIAPRLRTRRVIVVADGVLEYIPFAALPWPEAGQTARIGYSPLVMNHEFEALPSASLMPLLRRERPEGSRRPKTLLVLADPVFDRSDIRLRLAAAQVVREPASSNPDAPAPRSDLRRSSDQVGLRSRESVPRLPFSRTEAQSIVRFANLGTGDTAFDFDASRQRIMSGGLAQYRIIHFATHAFINTQNPELSGIILSLVDRQGRPSDGFLRLTDIYNVRLNADLVVLSACQTALGKQLRGEGLIGLTRAFMYAGTPRVLASLWKVDDRATAELMRRFYFQMLQQRLRPGAALRAAQISMAKDERWRSPYYWAGFVLQGEWL
jgi:CHAT domain-containing protein/tetratricopeptide (TPR) repeat protein